VRRTAIHLFYVCSNANMIREALLSKEWCISRCVPSVELRLSCFLFVLRMEPRLFVTSDIHMLLNSDETTIPHDLLSRLTKRMLLYSNSHDILSDLSLEYKYCDTRGDLSLSRRTRESKKSLVIHPQSTPGSALPTSLVAVSVRRVGDAVLPCTALSRIKHDNVTPAITWTLRYQGGFLAC
jgi:hypothetical protein